MLNKNLKKALIDNLPSKNVEALICFMENAGVKYYMADLRGPLALATFYGVYIDINNIKTKGVSGMLMCFVILHETAHMKRIKKLGKKEILRNLSHKNFDDFFNHVLTEELIADRYGCYMYYNLTKEVYPKSMTQNLHIKDVADRYKSTARALYGEIDNDEKKYKELVNKFIKKKY